MKNKFIWYWLKSCPECSMDIKKGLIENKINHKIFENYLLLLNEIKNRLTNLGLIQDNSFVYDIKEDFLISPKEYNKVETKTYKINNRDELPSKIAFEFYKKIILEDSKNNEILPPPTIFVITDSIFSNFIDQKREILE